MYRALRLSLLLTLLIHPAVASESLRYQGRLTDEAGVPITGIVTLELSIWDAAALGTELWTESLAGVDLTATNGQVDLVLGDQTPLEASLFDGADRWLQVAVDGEVLQPRHRLNGVPYALASRQIVDHTLDAAYDSGGQGAGRTITADAGPVTIEGAGGLNVDGPVGVGAVAPTFDLEVAGTAKLRGSLATSGLEVDPSGYVAIGGTAPSAPLEVTGHMNVVGSVGINHPAPAYDLHVVGTTKLFGNSDASQGGLYVSPDGQVSVGGETTGANLSVLGTAVVTGDLAVNAPGGVHDLEVGGSARLRGDGTTGGVTVSASGDVGISNETPGTALDVNGGVLVTGDLAINAPGGVHDLEVGGTAKLRGGVGTEGLSVSSMGQVAIGLPEPSYALDVDGEVNVSTLPINPGSNTLCSTDSSSGRIGTCGSTAALKDGIADLDLDYLEIVRELRPRRFHWKSSGELDLGFVAEEVEAVVPLLARHDERGEPLGVKYAQLTAVLLGALQEQMEINAALEERLNRLERVRSP